MDAPAKKRGAPEAEGANSSHNKNGGAGSPKEIRNVHAAKRKRKHQQGKRAKQKKQKVKNGAGEKHS